MQDTTFFAKKSKQKILICNKGITAEKMSWKFANIAVIFQKSNFTEKKL